MDFCHLAPTPHLDMVKGRRTHLVLAHLVEQDEKYREFYRNESINGSTIIMDNSAFEMYKQGRPMYDSDKLLEMGGKVKADYIALSDYPDQHGSVTIDAALEYGPRIKDQGFGTFFIPQSKIGDLEDLANTFKWAARSPFVDYIGFSILAIPNAYCVEDNLIQRFTARSMFPEQYLNRQFWRDVVFERKKLHYLGMTDGPNEIHFAKKWPIDTWDSSAAIWAGLNGIAFDESPTGLIPGKFEKEVDFNFHTTDKHLIETALDNMGYIDALCENGTTSLEV